MATQEGGCGHHKAAIVRLSMSEAIYTIGHSTHSLEHFIALLRQYGINALCDVRSSPYSRMNPQFNRETGQATPLPPQPCRGVLEREMG